MPWCGGRLQAKSAHCRPMRSIRLAPVDLQSIRLDMPLPFGLVDSRGVLLAHKGFVFQNESTLTHLANHGNGFYVDFSDLSDPLLRLAERDYVNQMMRKLRGQGSLEDLIKVRIRYRQARAEDAFEDGPMDWPNMVEICNSMLHTRDSEFFKLRLESVVAILLHETSANPDATLLALFLLSDRTPRRYCATHSLLVCAICAVTASSVLDWSDEDVRLLMRCALTMNIGMVDLQDALTQQMGPTDMSQQILINQHAVLSAYLLEMFGVGDREWLHIVRSHHTSIKDPLHSEASSDRMIGLLHRADVFSARLASRSSRTAQTASQAMKSIYYDEQSKTDAMGAAILKAVGVYRPGSFVQLSTGEIAVVIRRGKDTTTPMVVVVRNKNGLPSADILRDTSDTRYSVKAVVPSDASNVGLNLEKLMKLSQRTT